MSKLEAQLRQLVTAVEGGSGVAQAFTASDQLVDLERETDAAAWTAAVAAVDANTRQGIHMFFETS